jgi:hypothetical protein
MANPVQIANLALSWIGQDKINSFADNQNEAIIMNANYELSRDKVLEDAAWTFATERQVLSPLADTPAFGGGNKFLIPSTVLRVHRVYRPTGTSQSNSFQSADYVREGRYLIASEAALWVVFIIRVTDSGLFSPNFVHALAARMAADTVMTFTENSKLEEKMEARYDTKLADAKFSDGSQGTTETIKSTRLTGVRKR